MRLAHNLMKLVDEGLKKIFEKANVTDIIKAFGYMRNSGCYTRAESMSNALYYFDKKSVNEYDLVIHRDYRNSKPVIEFYKLANIPHLQDYISFCLTHKDASGFEAMDIHQDAYELVVEIEEANHLDTMYLLGEFKGIQMRRHEEMHKHQFVNGVINDANGDEPDMVEAIPEDVLEENRVWGAAMPEEAMLEEVTQEEATPEEVMLEEVMLEEATLEEAMLERTADRPIMELGHMVTLGYSAPDDESAPDDGPTRVVNNALNDLIIANNLQQERYETNLERGVVTFDDMRDRVDELLDNLQRVQQIIDSRR